MTLHSLVSSALACAFLFIAGCAPSNHTGALPAQRPRIEPPLQTPDSIRLVIYRPQTIVGMSGRPVIVINGLHMLTTLRESMLDPGSVFVVDAPAQHTQVAWIQSKQAGLNSDPIVYADLRGETRYLRWFLKPTYGYLQQVDERVAFEELAPLRYMGYRKLVDAKPP